MGAVAAHRGWHVDGAPENGIEALERAHARGVDWVEVDVRRMGDGTLVVHHDPWLGPRFHGTPLHQLGRHDLATHPGIVTFEDWAARAGELRAGVLAEVKSGDAVDAVNVLQRHLRDGRFDLMSFDPATTRRMAELAPGHPVGLLSYDLPLTRMVRQRLAPGSLVSNAERAGASFLALNVKQASSQVLEHARRAGMGVAVWTVDRPADLQRLLADARVATVITDVPDQALAVRRGLLGAHDASAAVRLLRAAATRH